MATNYPWNACLATKCLGLLAPNFGTHWANIGVQSALENARNYGNITYQLLEKEAQTTLLVLKSARSDLIDLPDGFWSFKSKFWKTVLCQSWLFEDELPCGIFGDIKAAILYELEAIKNDDQSIFRANNLVTKVSVAESKFFKTGIYIKLVIEGTELSKDVVEFFIHAVPSTSDQCPAKHTLKNGTKLVVSAKGCDAHDGNIIWEMGYCNILKSIENIVLKYRPEADREVICPTCLANSDPREAEVFNEWSSQPDMTMHCNRGHKVCTKMIYGSREGDFDTTNACTTCKCASHSKPGSGCRADLEPLKGFEDIKDCVVLVGLVDMKKRQILTLGTGFIADNSRGLIITAAHIFYNLYKGEKVEPLCEHSTTAIIGTIGKGNTASFAYTAQIKAKDEKNVDAVILGIKTKFNKPIQCTSLCFEPQVENIIQWGKFRNEKMEKLNIATMAYTEEQIRIIGYDQSGQGLHKVGQFINNTLRLTEGYVSQSNRTVSRIGHVEGGKYYPRSVLIVECTVNGGQSGAPCINLDGKVIGIVSSSNPRDSQTCYLVPSSELIKLLRKAGKD